MRRLRPFLLAVMFASGLAVVGGCAPERGVLPIRIETLLVSHRTIPCMSPLPCMEVRTPAETEWRLFRGVIEGFTPEPGYAYTLEVEILFLPPPIPADGADRAYRLRRIIARSLPE